VSNAERGGARDEEINNGSLNDNKHHRKYVTYTCSYVYYTKSQKNTSSPYPKSFTLRPLHAICEHNRTANDPLV
jgi:hypothetical protein